MQKEETEAPSVSKRLNLDNLLDAIRTNLKTKLQLSPVDLERLDKIQKSTGLDLRSFDDALTFKIALMVVKYMKYMESFNY